MYNFLTRQIDTINLGWYIVISGNRLKFQNYIVFLSWMIAFYLSKYCRH